MTQTTMIVGPNCKPITWIELQLVGMIGPTPSYSITPSLQVTIALRISDWMNKYFQSQIYLIPSALMVALPAVY